MHHQYIAFVHYANDQIHLRGQKVPSVRPRVLGCVSAGILVCCVRAIDCHRISYFWQGRIGNRHGGRLSFAANLMCACASVYRLCFCARSICLFGCEGFADMCVRAPQAKAFIGLTKQKAMEMAPSERTTHCSTLKSLPQNMLNSLKDCSQELKQTLTVATEVCSSDSGTDEYKRR